MIIKKFVFFIFLCFTICNAQYYSTNLSDKIKIYVFPKKPIAGQLAVIKFYDLNIDNQYRLSILSSSKKNYPIYEIDKFTTVLVGIPLDAKKSIVYKFYENEKLIKKGRIAISNKEYPQTFLKVSSKYSKPNKSLWRRIKKEQKKLEKARSFFSPMRFWGDNLIPPVPIKKISSPFGVARIFNGKVKSRHLGVDLPNPIGTPVHSIYPGRIVDTGYFYYGGKTILIDHGLGVISSYSHLSKIFVKKNDLVSAGEIIGEVGATGRVTGPHLHWGMYINTIPIDPISFWSNIRY